MRNVIAFIFMLVVCLTGACAQSPTDELATPQVIQLTGPAARSDPIFVDWRSRETLLELNGRASLAILGTRLSEAETILFYSLEGMDSAQLAKEYTLAITDDNANLLELVKLEKLARVDPLELGMLRFEGRAWGATQLILQVARREDEKAATPLLISEFDGSPDQDRRDHLHFVRAIDGVQQAGLRVELFFHLPPEAQSSPAASQPPPSDLKITPTPVTHGGEWLESLPSGVSALDGFSISVAGLENRPPPDFGGVFLSDGAILGLEGGRIQPLDLIYLPTTIPGPYPLPAP